MQVKDDELLLENTRRQLYAWGHWHNSILLSGLSYARKSIIGQLMDSKGVLIAGTNKNSLPENPEAEEIETLIYKLKQKKATWAMIIKYHYTNTIKTHEKARNLSLSVRHYQRLLLRAETWLAKQLEQQNETVTE